ncbi:ACIN1 [Bugula neritina]|uniref:ACIN1 n=1 Tax=Bugula neritina TaxID=10212 RepID=A0A7J7KCI3_BUGNE|nr:ACIN1 [Bugula neritina]
MSPVRKEPHHQATQDLSSKYFVEKEMPLCVEERSSKGERSSKDSEAAEDRKKRKWGGSRGKKPSDKKNISISTESLKEIMPDLKTSIDSEVVNGAAVPEVVEVDSAPSPGEKETKRRRQSSPEPVPSEGKAKRDERKSVEVRKTKKEEVQEEVMLSSEGDLSDGEIKVVKKVVKPSQTISLPVAEPVHVRKVSPPRNPVNKTIHVQFLTRPFTIGQLKELLSKYGALCEAEGSFWINKIKSHCYATFEDASSAEAARKELHGSRWPPSNPKILHVEFSKGVEEIGAQQEREASQQQDAAAKAKQVALEAAKAQQEEAARRLAEREKEREEARKRIEERRKERGQPQREWDKHKLRQSQSPVEERKEGETGRGRSRREGSRDRARKERSRSRHRDDRRGRRESAKEVTEEKAPVVSLDDLFRKTTTEPAIYWLPLTDEKIEQKAKEREERSKAYRERKEMEIKEKEAKAEERKKEIEERRRKVCSR